MAKGISLLRVDMGSVLYKERGGGGKGLSGQNNVRKQKGIRTYGWQFFARFLYGVMVHLNLNKHTPLGLLNRVLAFNQ